MFYIESILKDNSKRILKSDLLNGLEHFFTTRDVCIYGDDTGSEENKNLVAKYLDIDLERLVSPSQTHSSNVGIFSFGKTVYPETDALIIQDYDAAVFLNFADCPPIILWDEAQNIAAITHAGWRGTAGRIVQKTVLNMSRKLGSNPKDIKAVIGPSIGDCCYCIGNEVYLRLKETISDFEDCYKIINGKIYTNLKKINYLQLSDVGVEKIDICNYCTSCDNELFFSHRKENGTPKRHSAVVKLNRMER